MKRALNNIIVVLAVIFIYFVVNENFAALGVSRYVVIFPQWLVYIYVSKSLINDLITGTPRFALSFLATLPVSFLYVAIIISVLRGFFSPNKSCNSTQEQNTDTPIYFDRQIWLYTFIMVFLSLPILGSPPPYSAKWYISEGVALSSPTRTALGVICSENGLRPGLRYDDPEVGLDAPEVYTGKVVKSVSFSVQDPTSTKVEVVYKQISAPGWFGKTEGEIKVADGATWIYRGVCGDRGTSWFIDPESTLPRKYWPGRLPVFNDPGSANN